MALQNLPPVAIEYAADLRAENGAAVSAALRLWRRVGDDFDTGFLSIAPRLIEVMNTAQVRVSERAQAFIPDVMTATGQSRANVTSFTVDPGAFVGAAGNGMPTESLAYGAITTAKTAVGKGESVAQALKRGGQYLSLAMGTMLSDTRRGMEGLESASRPVTGYVRMLTPPSCGRCVILAGKRSRRGQAFKRHEGCDCVNIPSAESIAGDMTVNPGEYFDSLSDRELAKALGSKANAEAYVKYGTDPYQTVNAYRKTPVVGPDGKVRYIGGVRPAQITTRKQALDGTWSMEHITVKATLEGTTVRGYAGQQMLNVRQLTTVKDGRYRRVTAPRLMPESIIGLGLSKDRTAQLLLDHGWIVRR